MSDLVDVLKNYSIEQLLSLKRSISDDRAGLVKQIENLQHTIDHLLDQQQMLLSGTQTAPDGTRTPLLLSASSSGATPQSAAGSSAALASTAKTLSTERELASLQRQSREWATEKALLMQQREELLAQLKRFADAHESLQAKQTKRRAREAADREKREQERQTAAETIQQLTQQVARKEERIRVLTHQLESYTAAHTGTSAARRLASTFGGELRIESLEQEERSRPRSAASTPDTVASAPEGNYPGLLAQYQSTRDALLQAQMAMRTQPRAQ